MALQISRILHAGYVFGCDGIQIAFDPLFENPFSRNGYAYPAVEFDHAAIRREKFAAVFISHYHDDHFSLESLDLFDRDTPIYMFTVFPELLDLLRELGFRNLQGLDLNMPVQVGPFRVIPRRALDADVDSLFQIEASGYKILNVVDSWIDDDTLLRLSQEKPWDMVFWPFQTMRELEVLAPERAEPAPAHLPPEWIAQLRTLDPRFIVPSSCQFRFEDWSWYNQAFFPVSYRQFAKEVQEILPQARVVRLDPSASITLEAGGIRQERPLPWVRRRDQDLQDYEYDPEKAPMPTAEIAKHLPAPTPRQRERVLHFCREEILRTVVDTPEASYFLNPRIWRLTLYDEGGAPLEFYYRVEGARIEAIVPQTPSWSTEIPLIKLYGALEEGESLTSLYVRLHPPAGEVDLLEDPLLVRLYNGAVGRYQKYQLKRLRV